MSNSTPSTTTRESGIAVNRWWMLIVAIIAMMAIANLQYAWTFFTGPLSKSLNAPLAAVQVAFSTFILVETWLVPFEAYVVDKLGARLVIAVAGVLVGLGWIGSGLTSSLGGLYFWYSVGGLGAGAVYGTCMGIALKWFPDRRGLAAGMTAGAYGIGTALTIAPINAQILRSGYQSAFVTWGIIQGVIVLLTALVIQSPPKGWEPEGWAEKKKAVEAKVSMSQRSYTPFQMVTKAPFWMMYLMMTLVAFGGLMVTAQLSPIAKTMKMDKTVLIFGMTAVVLAAEFDRILNGITRPFWGWVSDHIGRPNTMAVAFTAEGIMIYLWMQMINHPLAFVLLSGFVFFAWGEIFSLFPATVGDVFGSDYATTNYGVMYTAKGTASIFSGPGAALLMAWAGSWIPVFWAGIICDLLAATLAWFWLRPLIIGFTKPHAAPAAGLATAGSH
jgi:OFA family oxalate/formate antiporter-like MFS transporter